MVLLRVDVLKVVLDALDVMVDGINDEASDEVLLEEVVLDEVLDAVLIIERSVLRDEGDSEIVPTDVWTTLALDDSDVVVDDSDVGAVATSEAVSADAVTDCGFVVVVAEVVKESEEDSTSDVVTVGSEVEVDISEVLMLMSGVTIATLLEAVVSELLVSEEAVSGIEVDISGMEVLVSKVLASEVELLVCKVVMLTSKELVSNTDFDDSRVVGPLVSAAPSSEDELLSSKVAVLVSKAGLLVSEVAVATSAELVSKIDVDVFNARLLVSEEVISGEELLASTADVLLSRAKLLVSEVTKVASGEELVSKIDAGASEVGSLVSEVLASEVGLLVSGAELLVLVTDTSGVLLVSGVLVYEVELAVSGMDVLISKAGVLTSEVKALVSDAGASDETLLS